MADDNKVKFSLETGTGSGSDEGSDEQEPTVLPRPRSGSTASMSSQASIPADYSMAPSILCNSSSSGNSLAECGQESIQTLSVNSSTTDAEQTDNIETLVSSKQEGSSNIPNAKFDSLKNR